ncbi:hypothetical protein HBH56_032150 [Parastagonospora nodorum]|uniref:Uncharacterized protein n=1 Tax=Phaeosphaeria nodorum (strain SN15 / ATCC MYA-4574 / FGSC 10173) TaxID=321614 RepID=A0A7U2I3G3_PHANO|nr:hypothetical protein HBH56_032150 [Parastagonospora nodorum]QRD00349.1 hypothetical protein JI435_072120 [Parastagonospora nodorum SN15]KAH3933836.1 hypothetical protein HBH54_067300 [Parastagonospora nodorum]KAH3952365.1 hypothetical protein HBH53_042750 [Parastagonospora nodorum]KAH3980413.1 hypothetical protein HBH52_089920 [Parastagonospora nodorum]
MPDKHTCCKNRSVWFRNTTAGPLFAMQQSTEHDQAGDIAHPPCGIASMGCATGHGNKQASMCDRAQQFGLIRMLIKGGQNVE